MLPLRDGSAHDGTGVDAHEGARTLRVTLPWRDPGAELRCIAPAKDARLRGQECGRIVTRVPAGLRLRVVGLVAHTSLAAPHHLVFACRICGHWHETEAVAVAAQLDAAA